MGFYRKFSEYQRTNNTGCSLSYTDADAD